MNNEICDESAAAARRATDRELVAAVAQVYKQFRMLPPVSAINFDSSPTSRSLKWSPETAHFIIDIEKALQFALDNKADVDALSNAWRRLQTDITIIDKDCARLIRLLAPVLHRRGLHPRRYFKPNKYLHRRASR